MKRALLLAVVLVIAASATADDGKPPSTGLSFFADAGAFWAGRATADFYSGRPDNANTILRVLHSETYGTEIWTALVRQQRISPTTIGSYQQLQVAEYPSMYYRTSLQLGAGLRYDYASGFGWLLRFDLDRLEAVGAFNLSATGGAGILGSDQYIRCGMLGREDRISIDLAITRSVMLDDNLSLELDLGVSLVNTQVKENLMEIASGTWSILDVWDGRTPDSGVGSYDYINQGGVGYGVFVSLLAGWQLQGLGALKAGYTCYQARTVLEGYTAWDWQHMLGVRIEMNNFSFFD